MRLLHVVAFSKKLRWLAQTKVTTLKTQLHAVNACVKRLSQRSFMNNNIDLSNIFSGMSVLHQRKSCCWRWQQHWYINEAMFHNPLRVHYSVGRKLGKHSNYRSSVWRIWSSLNRLNFVMLVWFKAWAIFTTATTASKNIANLKSSQKLLKNDNFPSLALFHDTHCNFKWRAIVKSKWITKMSLKSQIADYIPC